jgi:hypothetical protein
MDVRTLAGGFTLLGESFSSTAVLRNVGWLRLGTGGITIRTSRMPIRTSRVDVRVNAAPVVNVQYNREKMN